MSNCADTIINEIAAIEVIISEGSQGPPGPPGVSGTGTAIQLDFSWGDVSPTLITTVPAGKTVFRVEVFVQTPFDVASTLTIGDAGSTDRLAIASEIDLETFGVYQTNPGYIYGVGTAVNFYLSIGVGTSVGSGLILIYIQE